MEVFFSLWRPVLEILFIWGLVYSLIRLFQGTRAIQVLMGLIILAIIFNIAKVLELNAVNWVLTKLFAVGVVAFLIIFQPEMRRALARIGKRAIHTGGVKKDETVDEIVKACEYFSREKIGAIIAIERDMGLKNYVEGGISVNGKVTAEVLMSLFNPHTPTHDGGVIISGDLIASCGSFFPLTQSTNIATTLGTRHRAAIGLSEDSDAVCIVVSEETGNISIASFGNLQREATAGDLRNALVDLVKVDEQKNPFKEIGVKTWKWFQEPLKGPSK